MNNNPKLLYTYLSKFNATQFKIFYSVLVHYWMNYKCFMSKQNFFNLWCELNQLCHELDESFPDQYDDHEEIKSFCKAYPYYFIDKLPINLIASLFAEYVDNRLDVLAEFIKILYEQGSKAAYQYIINTLGLDRSDDELTSSLEEHIKAFS